MNEKVKEYCKGLREIADWYEAHPEIDLPKKELEVLSFSTENPAIARKAGLALGTFKKEVSDYIYRISKQFSGVSLEFVFYRDKVCVKKFIRTEVKKRLIRDPNVIVPMIEVEEEIEIAEWDCPPLLKERT